MPASFVDAVGSCGHVYHLAAAMEKPSRLRKVLRLVAAGALVAGAVKKLSPVRVEGRSMEPTLPEGSLVAVSALNGDPGLGSVVLVRFEDDTEHIKRVVAVPGDRFVGPAGLTMTLAGDEYAVVGDNRRHSTDSRHHGPVKRRDLVAVARVCYWPPTAWRLLPAGRSRG